MCQPDSSIIYYRGTLRPVNGTAGENRTVNILGLDLYVRGVVPREMPASWGTAAGGSGQNALRVQAVAARSFAAAGGNRWAYAKICDSQTCQVYGGAAKRATVGAALQVLEQPTSTTAVAETAGVVLLRGGAIASAMYSSSTGGITAGVAFPAVVDDGDVGLALPHVDHRSADGCHRSQVAGDRLAAGDQRHEAQRARRVGRARAGDDAAGHERSVSITGDQFRIGLGLRSNWFFVPDGCAGPQGGTPAPAPAAGALQALTPARVVDTRIGLNAPAAKVPAGLRASRPAGRPRRRPGHRGDGRHPEPHDRRRRRVRLRHGVPLRRGQA